MGRATAGLVGYASPSAKLTPVAKWGRSRLIAVAFKQVGAHSLQQVQHNAAPSLAAAFMGIPIMTYSKILVAIDQSPLGQAVFAQALDLAKTQNASLMLFHCLMPEVLLSPMLMPGEFGLSPHLISQTYKVQQEQLDLQVSTVR